MVYSRIPRKFRRGTCPPGPPSYAGPEECVESASSVIYSGVEPKAAQNSV